MKINLYPRSLLAKIAVGYAIILLIIGSIIYTGMYEWKERKVREQEARQISNRKQEIHDVYVRMLELSSFSETFIEWKKEDFQTYHKQRLSVDSLLCKLKDGQADAHLDSIRRLWEDKEQLMGHYMATVRMKEDMDRKIARRIPEIARQSVLDDNNKRLNFWKRLFRKRKNDRLPSTSSRLYDLDRNVIDRQREYTRRLLEQADGLAGKNRELNGQLRAMLRYMDRTLLKELKQREDKIAEAEKRSFATTSGQIAVMMLLLGASYAVIHRDMARINRYKRQLEKTVGQLEKTVAENKVLIESRKRIMLTVTHDLRTPLTAINGNIELLLTEERKAKREEYVRTVRQVTDRMASMLTGLLDFFRLESNKEKPNPVPFRIQSIADALQAEFMPLAIEKGLTFKVENGCDAVVVGDKKRILQIGANLLSNAVKFTSQGSITLRTDFSDGVLSLDVEDTGTGICEEEQKRIFTAFERLSNAVTVEGVGLGLAIVKGLAELLGGKIKLTSRLEKGSCFTFSVPLSLAEEIPVEYREKNSRMLPFTVLALDNDEVLLAMIKEMFIRQGVQCTVCANVRDMIEHLRYQNYDVLITDLKMPQMNGFDVLKLLRMANVGNSRTIPVIAATATGGNIPGLSEAGFAACLRKPFSADELMRVCIGCLGNKRQEERVDFHALLKCSDGREMLDTLIRQTHDDMNAMRKCLEKEDRKALDDWIHHLSSSWEMIHAAKPLREMYEKLHQMPECTYEELVLAFQKIIDKGREIIKLAQQTIQAYESDSDRG